jgi:hypothetical protein
MEAIRKPLRAVDLRKVFRVMWQQQVIQKAIQQFQKTFGFSTLPTDYVERWLAGQEPAKNDPHPL